MYEGKRRLANIATGVCAFLLVTIAAFGQIHEPIFPVPYPADPSCKKWCELNVRIEGDGKVSPGEGTRRLHLLPLDCSDPCAAPPKCEPVTLSITAQPSPGWQLYIIELNGDRYVAPALQFPALPIIEVKVIFIPQIEPGIDLLADFRNLLELFKRADEVYTFDQNGDPPLGAVEEEHFVGNHIPDAAEFVLFQTMLTEPGRLDMLHGGASPDSTRVFKTWLHNKDAAKRTLQRTDASEAVHRALATYMAVSSPGGRAFAANTLERVYGVYIDPRQFMSLPKGAMLPGSDFDGDRANNLEEWRAMAQPVDSLEKLKDFSIAVIDRDITPQKSKSVVLGSWPPGTDAAGRPVFVEEPPE